MLKATHVFAQFHWWYTVAQKSSETIISLVHRYCVTHL